MNFPNFKDLNMADRGIESKDQWSPSLPSDTAANFDPLLISCPCFHMLPPPYILEITTACSHLPIAWNVYLGITWTPPCPSSAVCFLYCSDDSFLCPLSPHMNCPECPHSPHPPFVLSISFFHFLSHYSFLPLLQLHPAPLSFLPFFPPFWHLWRSIIVWFHCVPLI